MPYAELEVLVERSPEGSHTVDMRFRAEPDDLDRDLASNVPISIDQARLLACAADPAAYGAALAAVLFTDQRLREAWITARTAAEARDYALRIRLRLDPNAPELHGVRWETVLDDQGVALARSERFLLSRHLDSADMTPYTPPTRPEVTALLVVASPTNLGAFNLAPFDAGDEAARVRRALGDIPAATLVSGSGAGPVSLATLLDALRLGYGVLYLVCHGKIVRGEPFLALEDEGGEVAWVPGDELAACIRDLPSERRPALVVLASCQSVGAGQDDETPSALGPQLARAGVVAVLGMQGQVPQAMVARMMPRFFQQLAEDGQIDQALAAARSGLHPDDPWWMPVLFLRTRDGRLWHDAAPRPAAAPAKVTPTPQARPAGPPRALWIGGALGLLALLALSVFAVTAGAQKRPEAPVGTQVPVVTAVAPATHSPALPTAPPLPEPTPAPPVPLADGKLMVLLSRIDAPAAGERDLTAELEGDLRRALEPVPFSDLAVARYDGAVGSEAEAEALAAASRAAVVVWGGGSGPAPVLHVQVGDPSVFPSIPPELSGAILRRTANVDLRLDLVAPELPSPSLAVLGVLHVLKSADGDAFEVLRVAALIDRLEADLTPAEPIGGGTAPKVHRYLRSYFSEPAQARPEIDAAKDDDPANPLLYLYSAILYQRLGQYEEGYEDAQAAYDAAPSWASPAYLLAVDRFAKGFVPQSLAYLDDVVSTRPGDSYALAYRGAYYYLVGLDAAARADLEEAIRLGSKTSLPYNYAAALALRQGRVQDARELIAAAGAHFQSQRSFDNNFYRNLFGEENILGMSMGALELLSAGQNRDAIASAGRALAVASPVVNERLRADMHFVIGFAECRRGMYQEAADAYTQALAADQAYGLVYLLRAEARYNLGDGPGSLADLDAAAQSPQAEQLAPTIRDVRAGELSCQSVLP